ncbi:MAG: ATP-binding cassette domain-containing protein [archaeon]
MSRISVSAENLVKKFGRFTAVDGISFSVRKGEIFGFLGPNGAGKSTTINVLTTLLSPSKGTAFVAGAEVSKNPEKVRERISLISQEGSADGDLTAEENLRFYGKLYHVPESSLERRIGAALDFVDLTEKRKIQVRFFSGGMKRRLEIAKVFISDPEVIFLDEPTIGLDPQSREMIWKKIFEIGRSRGITIFITTHYMQEAEALCNRIAIMDHGKIIAIGTPLELKKSIGISEIVEFEVVSGREDLLVTLLEKGGFSPELLSKGRIRISSGKTGAVKKIAHIAGTARAEISEIYERKPTMEDVFLHYTGREVRDEKSDGLQLTHALARRLKGS